MPERINSVWQIAKRDWLEATSTKMFWFGALLMPVISVAIAIFAMFAVAITSTASSVGAYYVVDKSGGLGVEIRNEILRSDLSNFVFVISPSSLSTDDDDVLRELHSAAQADNTSDLVDSLMEYLAHPQQDLSTLNSDSLAARFSKWWLDNPNRVVQIAPNVSFARYDEILTPNLTEQELNSWLKTDKIVGYFVIPPDFLRSNEGAKFVTENILKDDLSDWYTRFATRAIQNKRFAESNISRETAVWLLQRASFRTSRTKASATSSTQTPQTGTSADTTNTSELTQEVTVWETVGEFAPAIYQYILWFLVFIGATVLMSNTVEEKSTKLVEVLLSNLDPVQLMDGKLLGSALTLLTVVGLWIFLLSVPLTIGSGAIVMFLPQISEFLGSGALDSIFNPLYVINFVIFFVLGFAFYGYALSAMGSVCSNIREAQLMSTPINLVIIVPLIFLVPIALDKTGALATIMSYIPPFTPFVMMNIVAETNWTYFLILLWMTACTLGVRWFAGQIYTKGILLENKPAGIKGLVRLVGSTN